MQYELTDGARRALGRAAQWRTPESPEHLAGPALLLGLLEESECRAAIVLAEHGIDAAAVREQWPTLRAVQGESAVELDRWLTEAGTLAAASCSADVVAALAAAAQRIQQYSHGQPLATEHLLLGLAATDHPTSVWLKARGLDADRLEARIRQQYGHQIGPLDYAEPSEDAAGPLPFEEPDRPVRGSRGQLGNLGRRPPVHAPSPWESMSVLRILDAAANRAREGLRVIEDYARFVLDDRHLTEQLKQVRHELTTALAGIPMPQRLAARETQADVGTELTSSLEYRRSDGTDVLAANFARLQESLRSLEEYGKLADPDLARHSERIRYRTYTLQRAIEYTRSSVERLGPAQLYVLMDGGQSPAQLQMTASALVAAGVHMIQLRDKELDDRQLVERGRLVAQITRETDTLFVMNDRPDLAVLAGADGVHVGQEELTVKDARTMVGASVLVGVSTHSLSQARQAVLDGADYIGVGPVFPSGTKRFEQFPGLELVRQVAHEIRLPAFAIGGITPENVSQVVAAGLRRVAVSAAVTRASDPPAVVRQMLGALRTEPQGHQG